MTDSEIRKFLLARALPDGRYRGFVMVPSDDLPDEYFRVISDYLSRLGARLEPLDVERAAREKIAMVSGGTSVVIGDEPRGYWFVPELLGRR